MGPLIVDIKGLELDAEEKELLQHPLIGGVILFSRNYYNSSQLIELINKIQLSAKRRLLMAVDQEGGRVQRFRHQFTAIPAARSFAALNEKKEACRLAQEAGWVMAVELINHHIDISFAPVLDVGFKSQAIGDRSFHSQPEWVVELASSYITGMKQAGMKATGKHFPGHGAVKADSHKETPMDPRPWHTLAQQDLFVFKSLIQSQLIDAIMPAHVIYSAVDSLPASGSAKWLKQILRQQLAFAGVIFSDDLSMVGAEVMGNIVERAKVSLDAGCDLLLICNNRSAVLHVLDHLPQHYDCSAKISSLYHQGNHIDLAKLSRWQQAHQQLTELSEKWNQIQ